MADMYNGRTLAEIENNFPLNMPEIHREIYLENCREVIKIENSGFNLNYIECVKNTNFNLINFYLNNK